MSSLAPVTVSTLLAVAVGGAVGAAARYWLSVVVNQLTSSQFPWGTFAVNFIASLLFGLISVLAARYSWVSETGRLLLITGGLGALSTFSTFSAETLQLIQDDRVILAGLNIAANVLCCLIAVWLGFAIAHRL